jgi:hypothetical protein
MKTRITITIDPEVLERVKALADRERRSVSSMIEVLLFPAVQTRCAEVQVVGADDL